MNDFSIVKVLELFALLDEGYFFVEDGLLLKEVGRIILLKF